MPLLVQTSLESVIYEEPLLWGEDLKNALPGIVHNSLLVCFKSWEESASPQTETSADPSQPKTSREETPGASPPNLQIVPEDNGPSPSFSEPFQSYISMLGLNLEGIYNPLQQLGDEELDPGYGTMEQDQILRLCDEFSNTKKPPYTSEEIQVEHVQQRQPWTSLDGLDMSGLRLSLQHGVDTSEFTLRPDLEAPV